MSAVGWRVPGGPRLSACFPGAGSPGPRDPRCAALKLVFAALMCTRTLHPMFIEASKQDSKILYAQNTPIVVSAVLQVVLMNLLAFLASGREGLRLCWQPQCLRVFGFIGLMYALGDCLEMSSMAALRVGIYKVLEQSKLLVTALMCSRFRGSGQSVLQWHILFAVFLATSSFIVIDQSGSSWKANTGLFPVLPVACVSLKVVLSCYCAVLSEKYIKSFSAVPLFAKISCLSTSRVLVSMLLCCAEPRVVAHGLFAHWDGMTCLVALSFTMKALSAMYLLRVLDPLRKNIGEAFSLILIYASQVSLPWCSKEFDLSVCLPALLVAVLVKTYSLVPPSDKPKEPLQQQASILTRKVQLVSLTPKASPLMQRIGIRTFKCEVAQALPTGVFYGMLAGMYPVCGSTHAGSPMHCELTLLSQPPGETDLTPGDFSRRTFCVAPFLPQLSLTVLGHGGDPLPGAKVFADLHMQDIERMHYGTPPLSSTVLHP